jgi:eukaryotic-like serine/threonine-protein kinase
MNPEPTQPDSAAPPRYPSENIANVISAVRELQHPKSIGPYQIQAVIGEGGMGTVYRAEQHSPIRRTVAVKIIKLGMDTRQVIARFESERQALAMMDHPNVAKVLDAGATDTGRPYFVMEHVQGEPITAFADRHRLTLAQRLELFMQACAAVQHAHQKAIIHRDLKPSNMLVTRVDDKPQVKVIDFGVAKATSHRLTDKTLFTETGQLLGTPEYMAPEQAEGSMLLDVDTRSDVYSLGVVLYELLTGSLPFEAHTLRSGGYNEIQRIIREVDPPRPSGRLSQMGERAEDVAHLRRTPLQALGRQLRHELDWIPLRAMHKERARRYASATELAEDVQNYLENRPLRAAPDSAGYRARKFLRRNKRPVAAAVVALLMLLGGVGATSWQAVRATRAEARIRAEQERTLQQKREAERQRAEAEDARAASMQVNAFLVDMLQSADPWLMQRTDVLVRDVLDKAAADVGTKLSGQPGVEAAVRSALGRAYLALGLYPQAEPHITGAMAIHRQLGGDDHPEAIDAQQRLGLLRHKQSRLEESLLIYQDTLERRRRILGEDHPDTIGSLNDVAVVLHRLGQLSQAEPMYRDARERYHALLGPEDRQTLHQTGNLGQLLVAMGRNEAAERELRAAFEGRRRVLGENHPDTLSIGGQLANVLRILDRLPEAEDLMRDSFERTREVFGADHPHTIFLAQGLGLVLGSMDRHEESMIFLNAALERSRRTLGDDSLESLTVMRTVAEELTRGGKPEEAEPLLRESYDGHIKRLGAEHRGTLMASYYLVIALQKQAKWEEALPIAQDLFERLRDPGRVQLDRKRRAQFMAVCGINLTRLGRHAEAMEALMLTRSSLMEAFGDSPSASLAPVLGALVKSADALGRPEDAARFAEELAALNAPAAPAPAPGTMPATVRSRSPSR